MSYAEVPLKADGSIDYDGVRAAINARTKLVTIQRSKGYATRPTLSVRQIGELIAFVKSIRADIICMVDNCYGEFVETIEPSDVGADMIVGSLIKNCLLYTSIWRKKHSPPRRPMRSARLSPP